MATKTATYDTIIDIVQESRLPLTRLLNKRLADMIDLFNQTKHAHWNVKGPEFMRLHELFDDIAERVEDACDLLSERVVILGGAADFTATTTRSCRLARRL